MTAGAETRRRATVRVPGVEGTIELELHDARDRVVSETILADGAWEPFETSLLVELMRDAGAVLDVGANIGWYALLAARLVRPGGTVLAFEPDPDNHRLLAANLERNGASAVEAIRALVADRAGSRRLHRSASNLGDRRLFARDDDGASIEVPAMTLDEACAARGLEPDFIKLDTQGAETHILRGARGLLDGPRPPAMLVELWPFGLVGSGSSVDELADEIGRRDWELAIVFEDARRALPASLEDVRRWGRTILAPETRRFANLLLFPPARPMPDALRRRVESVGEAPARLDLGAAGAEAWIVPEGWSFPEPWGRWIDGAAGELRYCDPGHDLAILLEGHAHAAPDHPVRGTIAIDGEVVDRWTSVDDAPFVRRIAVPTAGAGRLRAVTIETPDAIAPRARSGADDDRRLGLAWHGWRTEPA